MAAKPTVIPSVFTAVDKFSSPLQKMERSVQGFASRAESALARSERSFRRFAPALSETGKELVSFMGTAALAGSAVAGIGYSYQSLQDYEDAVASFRTIISDATNNEFSRYEEKIGDVANATRKSTIDVAKSFERIAGLNASFAKTATGLAEVSQASITLAKASKMELEPATDSLVGIMNQFSLAADQADRTINVLAAGQAVGAASIQQTSEAFVNFGSVAAGANISLEQSVALVQTLGKFSLFGAEAGTKLRGAVIKLQQANVGYQSGQFSINDALSEAKSQIDRLSTAKEKDAAITKMFGLENVTAGRILLNNIDLYKGFVDGVTGTTEAQKAAEIQSATLSTKVEELKAKYVNLLTTNDAVGVSMNFVKGAISFVTNNMETLLAVGTAVVGFFVAWKLALIAGNIAMGAYNIGLAIMAARTGIASVAIGQSTLALNAYKVALFLASPVGLLTVAVVGLTAAFFASTDAVTKESVALQINKDIKQRVINKTIDQKLEVEKLFRTLYRAQQGTDEYNGALARLEQLQPGIIAKHKLEEKSIQSLSMAYVDLIKNIEKRAEAEAAQELYVEAVKERQRLEVDAKSKEGQGQIEQFFRGFYEYDETLDRVKERLAEAQMRESQLKNKVVATEASAMPMVNTTQTQVQTQNQNMTNTNNAALTLNINDPNGRVAPVKNSPSFVTVKTNNTR